MLNSVKKIITHFRQLRIASTFSLMQICQKRRHKKRSQLSNLENQNKIPRLDTFMDYLLALKHTIIIVPLTKAGVKENKELCDLLWNYSEEDIALVLTNRVQRRLRNSLNRLKKAKGKKK